MGISIFDAVRMEPLGSGLGYKSYIILYFEILSQTLRTIQKNIGT